MFKLRRFTLVSLLIVAVAIGCVSDQMATPQQASHRQPGSQPDAIDKVIIATVSTQDNLRSDPTPTQLSKPLVTKPDSSELASVVASEEELTVESEPSADITSNCPVKVGPAVAVNRWSPYWGSGLNEVWVIPITEANVSLEDQMGNLITLAPGMDPAADMEAGVNTYEVGPKMSGEEKVHEFHHHACNLTQTDLVQEYVLGSRPKSTEILIYRTNEHFCETFIGYELPNQRPGVSPLPAPPQSQADCEPKFWQIVLIDVATRSIRVVVDFGKNPLFDGPQGLQTNFSPNGSKLSYIEPCWQEAQYQESIETTGLVRKRCQDGGYIVVVDLESMSSRVIHGSENDATIISQHQWSPDGSSILIRQRCAYQTGMRLPEDTTREEKAACNGIWTIAATLQSDHFEPQQILPINRFFDCDDFDGSIIEGAVWSPSGDAITVSAHQNAECKRGIWEIQIDSGEYEKLMDCPFDSEKLSEPKPCGSAKWSPTGEQFLFFADSDGFNNYDSVEVWVGEKAKKNPWHVSPWYPTPEGAVEWSPDGRTIAFHTSWRVRPSLLMIEADDPTKIVTVPYSGTGVRGFGFAWVDWAVK